MINTNLQQLNAFSEEFRKQVNIPGNLSVDHVFKSLFFHRIYGIISASEIQLFAIDTFSPISKPRKLNIRGVGGSGSYGGPKAPRQFQFDHGNFNLTTATSIWPRQFQFDSRQFQFDSRQFQFNHGNFNLTTLGLFAKVKLKLP